MNRTEIRITGFGGQGVVLSGYIIGRACAIDAGKHATMIQSFGPEARGSACSATLTVSDTEVLYPYIGRPDIFVVMSSNSLLLGNIRGATAYPPSLSPIEGKLPPLSSRAFIKFSAGLSFCFNELQS